MTRKDDIYDIEEDFFSGDRKESMKERKRAESSDRSKFKKSDQDQLKKRESVPSQLPVGRVLAITVDGLIVDAQGTEITCSVKGSLKQDKQRIKNIIAVGDFVHFDQKEDRSGVITDIQPRRSILSRADNLSRNKEQIIAVNIDQVFITCSVVQPPLKSALIDRYIIAAQKGKMDPIIVINKIDLLPSSQAEQALYEEVLRAYKPLNIPVLPVSTVSMEGIDALYAQMQGKTSVFSGQSGAGKSSLINLILGTNMRTGSVVHKTGKGAHTTTATHLVPLQSGGFCIDTPGIRSFGLWDFQKEDLVHYFPEFYELDPPCRYPDCSHLSEPDCAVRKAVEENRISSLRFDSYCALMKSLSEQHRLR